MYSYKPLKRDSMVQWLKQIPPMQAARVHFMVLAFVTNTSLTVEQVYIVVNEKSVNYFDNRCHQMQQISYKICFYKLY